jgi:Cytidylate kinase-like family
VANNYSNPGASAETDLDRCRLYLNYQFDEQTRPLTTRRRKPPGPAITISDQTGSGAHDIASRLAALLQAGEPKGTPPWTVFDRQLVEKVLEEHHLPKRLAKLMPEDRRSYLADVVEELLGLRPPSWVLVPKIVQSVLHLAEAGHVILVGRGASFITGRMPNVFHTRLIASLPKRVERVQKLENLSPKEAAKFIARSDRGRGRYVKAYFHSRVDNDLLYHMVLNTDLIPLPEAAELIADGARRCFRRKEVP